MRPVCFRSAASSSMCLFTLALTSASRTSLSESVDGTLRDTDCSSLPYIIIIESISIVVYTACIYYMLVEQKRVKQTFSLSDELFAVESVPNGANNSALRWFKDPGSGPSILTRIFCLLCSSLASSLHAAKPSLALHLEHYK